MKYVTRITITCALLLLFLTPTAQAAEARTVVRSGDGVSIAEDQVIRGDFYSAANTINVSGTIENDMIAIAAQININGSIGDDALFVAGRTDVHGVVGDDLRIVSNETVIAEPVMGDVLVIGGSVNILSTASISGDVVLYAGDVTIEGSVGGDVIGSADSLRIDAAIAGDIDVTVADLTLGDRANIEGSVRYVSNSLAIQSPNATVVGDMVRNDPILPGKDMNIRNAMIPVLVLLFSALVWYLVSRRSLTKVANRALISSSRPFLIGLGTVVLAPFAGFVLLISLIGSLVGIAVFTAYILLGTLSIMAMSAVLGMLLMRAFNRPVAELSLMTLMVGVAGVILLMLLPFVGQLLLFALLVVSVGAMVDLVARPNLS